ncbi:Putative glycoside hydrolase, family 5, glycoside hydrolase superfamily [Colletotrichum destructivum]|uniref:Glycoside hydrolase, family 5, glycoside hydrolase superfamily n=1 Tax=Colletotrichum destructivum TaxID=34406 RepID=A0AAX4IVI6_9PEZI|nr:Putative glycoside hydrolase, family 5, glycoside hydrolase superfamily [Colletotrichum destructivum]
MRRLSGLSALLTAPWILSFTSAADLLSRRDLQPLPLSVHDRYIVDSKNATVAMVGVNWAGHERAMIPEGLQYQSVEHIVRRIAETGFNSVRLTFASEMVDDIVERGGDVSLKTTLQNALGPENGTAVMAQIIKNNPAFGEGTRRLEIWDAVAAELARQKLYLHLDNHVSKAGWCCNPYDGNGWFGDTNFNTSNWVRSLSFMAEHGKAANWPSFSSIGLRNELRDPFSGSPPASLENTTWTTWKTRMVQAANAVHAANPDLLIFFSGRIFDFDISAPVQGRFGSEPDFGFALAELPFRHKFVFEQHQYDQGLVDDACANYRDILTAFGSNAMTIADAGSNRAPLVMSEWGHDQADESGMFKDKFRRCLMDFMVDQQMSWMVWVMGGSYYTREGVQDRDEPWGEFECSVVYYSFFFVPKRSATSERETFSDELSDTGLLDHTWSSYRGKDSIKQLQHDMQRTYEAFHQNMPAAAKSPENRPKNAASGVLYHLSSAAVLGTTAAVVLMGVYGL